MLPPKKAQDQAALIFRHKSQRVGVNSLKV